MNIKWLFPFLRWIRELNDKSVLKADIIAGLSVALVLIPQSMAYAQLAGLAPYYWLYASFLPVIISALWWSSRQLATWPVAIVSLITASALEPLAITWVTWYAVYAAFLALIVWIIQLTFGICKLWKLVDFLSHPVILGFTNAAAIVIWSSQLSKIFFSSWYAIPKLDYKYEEFIHIFLNLSDTHLLTLIIWLSSIALLFWIKNFIPKLPWVLIAVIVFTTISYIVWYEIRWWSVVWSIPIWLPWFSLPFLSELFDWEKVQLLIGAAFTIAILGFAEAISIAKSMAWESKKSISANRELIGQWLGNITASAFHWYPVSGSFSRSAVNFKSWAQTWFSSVITWLLVGITLLYLSPFLYHLPQATLAAVIILAVSSLIKIQPFIYAWKVEKHDWIIWVIVFFVTLFSAPHLEKWLIVWVWLSLALFIYRSMTPNFAEVAMYTDKELRNIKNRNLKASKNVWVYQFEWPLYFASSGYFEGKLIKFVKEKPKIKLILLDFGGVDEIDSSWLEALENIIENFEKAGIKVLLSRIRTRVYIALIRSKFIQRFGEENIFRRSRHEALEYAKETLGLKINIKPYYEYTPKRSMPQEKLNLYQKLIKKIIRDRGDI